MSQKLISLFKKAEIVWNETTANIEHRGLNKENAKLNAVKMPIWPYMRPLHG